MHNDTTIYLFHTAPGSRSKFILKIDGDQICVCEADRNSQ